MPVDWEYSKKLETYLCGNQLRGAGVYLDSETGEWFANVVTVGEIWFLGPFATFDDATRKAEEKLEKAFADLDA